MAKAKQPIFEQPPLSSGQWTEAWREWLRDIVPRINERLAALTLVVDNLLTVDSNNNIVDSGISIATINALSSTVSGITSELIEWVGTRYITENLLSEAGTEEGSRYGSFKIGLLTENDYAYFDKNGSLVLYGVTGLRIVIPVNTSSLSGIAVFDSTGNLKYFTSEQLSSELSTYLASKAYIGERYITESPLPEAQIDDNYILYNQLQHIEGMIFYGGY